MKQLELDLIITHPDGVDENLKSWLVHAINSAVEQLGCELGGSFILVDEIEDKPLGNSVTKALKGIL